MFSVYRQSIKEGLFPKPGPTQHICINVKGEKWCLDLICIQLKKYLKYFEGSWVKFISEIRQASFILEPETGTDTTESDKWAEIIKAKLLWEYLPKEEGSNSVPGSSPVDPGNLKVDSVG